MHRLEIRAKLQAHRWEREQSALLKIKSSPLSSTLVVALSFRMCGARSCMRKKYTFTHKYSCGGRRFGIFGSGPGHRPPKQKRQHARTQPASGSMIIVMKLGGAAARARERKSERARIQKTTAACDSLYICARCAAVHTHRPHRGGLWK